MANIKKDDNLVTVVAGVLNTDGITPTLAEADPSTHELAVLDGTSGNDYGSNNAARDSNGNTVLVATDSNGSIIPLYVDNNGNLLVQSS